MHDYSIDKHPKGKITFFLAYGAIALAPLLNKWIGYAAKALGLSGILGSALVTAVPVFTLFLGLYYLFNEYLWRVRFLRRFLLVPDLNGTWACVGKTTIKNSQPAGWEWSGTITITQSWSKIMLHLKTQSSTSKSTAASIQHDPGVGYRLLYQYENVPSADQPELARHSGSVEMVITESCNSADGHYFTDQHRSTVGTISWRKKENATVSP